MNRRFVRMFKPRFAALVLTGAKKQTVRPIPKRVPLVGDVLDARQWSGRPYNSPQVKLGEFIIRRVAMFEIHLGGLMLDGAWLSPESEETFARADGFTGIRDMLEWFRTNHGERTFVGICIFWQ